MSTKNYGRVYYGPLIIERLDTLPSWTSADVGRIVYVNDVGKMYIGENTQWVEGGGGGGGSGTSGSSGTSGISDTYAAVSIAVFDASTDCVTGNGGVGFVIPYQLNGYNLIDVLGSVATPGSTNTMNIMVRRARSGVQQDMLSLYLGIASGGYYARNGTISNTYKDVATGDLLFIDVDTIHGTAAKGLSVALTFQKP